MNNKGWLIYSQADAHRNKSYIDWFILECEKQELELKLVLKEKIKIGIYKNNLMIQLSGSYLEPLPDFAVVRVIDPLLNLQLEKAGVLVFNSAETARIANDKALAHLYAASIGVPMLDTIFIKRGFLTDIPPMPFPFVIKQTNGRSGEQVRKVMDQQQWLHAKTRFFEHDTIIQNNTVIPGRDLRVFVIGKEIIAAVLRENNHDFRANISVGGKAHLYQLNEMEKSMINRVIAAFDFGLVGIDFLFDPDGNLLFNEIEDAVGSRSLSKISSINLLEHYTTFIKTKLTKQ